MVCSCRPVGPSTNASTQTSSFTRKLKSSTSNALSGGITSLNKKESVFKKWLTLQMPHKPRTLRWLVRQWYVIPRFRVCGALASGTRCQSWGPASPSRSTAMTSAVDSHQHFFFSSESSPNLHYPPFSSTPRRGLDPESGALPPRAPAPHGHQGELRHGRLRRLRGGGRVQVCNSIDI